MAQTGSSGVFKVGAILFGRGVNTVGCMISTFTGTLDTANTYKNTEKALPGSLVIDLTGKKLYQNTGTKASPTWTQL